MVIEGRICTQCKTWKAVESFSWKLRGKRLSPRCHECKNENYKDDPIRARQRAKEHYWKNKERIVAEQRLRREAYPERYMHGSAKKRAKELGLPFNLDVADCMVPANCPVLGIPLVVSAGRSAHNSPSLDRIVPALGYVKGNVVVVSHRANTIKSDATLADLAAVLSFYSTRM